MNTADALALEAGLRLAGAEPAPAERADLVIVNTCSVTASADQGARQSIRRVARQNPTARLVVTGCYASRRPQELLVLPGVVRVVSNDGKRDLRTLVDSLVSVAAAGQTARSAGGPCGAPLRPGVAGRTAWTLAVQTGCDEACSYCVIPRTRGRGRSVTVDDVRAQVGRAVDQGYREVVLAGVHLGSYGRDLTPARTLAELLGTLARQLDGAGVRVRVSSIEPMDVSDDLLDIVSTAPCFAPHLHVPLQHASDRVLRAMRRPYTLAEYARAIEGIRRRLPNAAIGADVMVGFPGEQEDDVDALCRYLESSPLTSLHVFPYSERPGTEAVALGGRVEGATVRSRAARVRDISSRLQDRFRRAQIGTEHDALTLEDGTMALTGNYCKVRVPAGRARNEWVRVRVRTAGES